MKKYSEFKPSQHDCAGLGLVDQQDWLVAPCSTSRDADTLQEANWLEQKARLEACADDESFEIHRFGHWACGWFEIAIVKPNSVAYDACVIIEQMLENYCILSENRFTELGGYGTE